MKTIKYLAMAAFAVCLAACGGKKSDDTIEETVDSLSSVVDEVEEPEDLSPSLDSEDDLTDVEEVSDGSSSSDSEDWDALLDSYDSYVTKYISFVKKAANGDMSAMAEYPALMQKAQEFSDKMSDAEDDMSASQWARYIKITNRMTKAAAEMQ